MSGKIRIGTGLREQQSRMTRANDSTLLEKQRIKQKPGEILKAILRQLDDEGGKVIDVARLTFNNPADHYQKYYSQPAEFVGDRKVAGLRDWKHVRGFS